MSNLIFLKSFDEDWPMETRHDVGWTTVAEGQRMLNWDHENMERRNGYQG